MEREELLKEVREILKVRAPVFESWTDEELNELYVVLKVKDIKAE